MERKSLEAQCRVTMGTGALNVVLTRELEKADAGITVYGLRVWPLWGRLASTREMDSEPVYTVC